MAQRGISPLFGAVSLVSLALMSSACTQFEAAKGYITGEQPAAVAAKPVNQQVGDVAQAASVEPVTSPPAAQPERTAPVLLGSASVSALSEPPAALSAPPASIVAPVKPEAQVMTPAIQPAVPAAQPSVPAAQAAPAAVDTRKPLLVVRFNQPHVYFEQAVNDAVKAAEGAKPGVLYNVVSYLPDISKLPAAQQANVNARATENMRSIVEQIQQAGVPAERIRIANVTQTVSAQEVKLFVQ